MITGDIWQKVNDEILSVESIRKAVIAYITKKSDLLEEGDFLICDASEQAVKYGKTSSEALNFYYDNGVQIYSLENLHSKFLFTENVLIVGSANLSNNSAERLTESAIVTRKKDEISNASAFFYTLTQEAEKVDRKYLERISRIKVISKENISNKKSKSREIDFGESIWLVGVTPLSEKVYENEVEQVEETKSKISEIHEIEEDDISFIRFTRGKKTERIRRESKIGDLIIEISNNKERTISTVREATPILEVEYEENCVRIYFNSNGMKELNFTRFIKEVDKLPVKKVSKLSLRKVTEDELFYINQIMKKIR